MIAEALDGVAGVFEEKRWIFRLDVVILCRRPEVVPDEQSVLVGEIVEHFLGILPDPISNHVDIRVMVQAEVGLEARPRDAFAGVVHAPVCRRGTRF